MQVTPERLSSLFEQASDPVPFEQVLVAIEHWRDIATGVPIQLEEPSEIEPTLYADAVFHATGICPERIHVISMRPFFERPAWIPEADHQAMMLGPLGNYLASSVGERLNVLLQKHMMIETPPVQMQDLYSSVHAHIGQALQLRILETYTQMLKGGSDTSMFGIDQARLHPLIVQNLSEALFLTIYTALAGNRGRFRAMQQLLRMQEQAIGLGFLKVSPTEFAVLCA